VRSVARLELAKGVLYEEGRTLSQWYSSRRTASLYERFREIVLLLYILDLVEYAAFRYWGSFGSVRGRVLYCIPLWRRYG
jgi:hypothetical protein